jgi:hypothetical protein
MASKESRGPAVIAANSIVTVCVFIINTDVSWWMKDKPGTYRVRLLSFRTGIIKRFASKKLHFYCLVFDTHPF